MTYRWKISNFVRDHVVLFQELNKDISNIFWTWNLHIRKAKFVLDEMAFLILKKHHEKKIRHLKFWIMFFEILVAVGDGKNRSPTFKTCHQHTPQRWRHETGQDFSLLFSMFDIKKYFNIHGTARGKCMEIV